MRVLADAGMAVESHTRRHRVLETLDDDELREELVGSRRELEFELGRPVRAIAYPVGRHPSDRVRRATAAAGYRIAFSNSGGVNHVWPHRAHEIDAFDVHRISTERGQSDALFLAQLTLPLLADH